MKYLSERGYIAKALGAGYVAIAAAMPILNIGAKEKIGVESMLAPALIGAAIYFIGDRIHTRELNERNTSALEKMAEKHK